jgi:hypothetical protein
MANKFLYAFCADDVPDSNGCIVTTSQKPLAFNWTIFFEYDVGLNAQNPASVTFVAFYCTCCQIICVNRGVHASYK